ncbi:MAG: PAS domain S-box protein, partial [Ktedonobacteraceae bacterium]|nr:PAS domain S-box protein [Ktedonobacteraceae bacterium]
MHHGKSIASTLLAPHSELTSLLDTLPDALIFLDKNATILYANASAATMVGAKQHELPGHTLWQSAPPLVTPALYQAVITATHTRKPLQVTYRSPSTRTRLRVHLSPTSQGVALFFSEETEPAQLQDLLGQSEQRYQDLLESTSDRVTILTPDGLILDANQRCLADAQARRETVVGRPFTDFPLWSSVPTVQQQVRSAIAQASRGDTAHCEVRILPQPGRSLDLALTITPHRGANQAVEYLICAAQDITARKQAEADQHVLVEAIPHFVWIMRPDGSSEYSNQRWCDYTNTTTEQLQGNGWIQSLLHPDERQHVLEVWQNSVRTGAPYKIEHRIRDGKTGTYRWFLAQGIPYRDAQGTILRWFGTCTDIDEQKQAEERIRASEQKLRVLAETVPQLVWTTLADGRLDYANQRYLDFIHTDFEHLRDYRWRQFVHPEDAERTLAVRQHSLDTGEPYEIEYRFRDGRTGTYRWLLTRALPLRDESGQITKWFGTGTDIDEQKRTEHALRESQQRTHTLMESNIIGIFVAEGDEIVEANDAFLRMTGYSREDLQQSRLNWVHMTPPEYVVLNQQIHQKLKIHQSVPSHEKEYICKDGSRLPVLVGG